MAFRRAAVWIAAMAVVVVVCGCSSEPAADAGHPRDGETPTTALTVEYLPGLALDLRVPARMGPGTPVGVLVPGGAWRSADRRGLDPLAARLAAAGAVTANTRVRAADDGVVFPVPVADVLCAAAFASARAAAAGAHGPLVLVGHSSGAHLTMLAALDPDRYADPACPYAYRPPDAVAGLAGIYDLDDAAGVAEVFVGAARASAPARWQEASAVSHVGHRPDVAILLAHGDADELVPMRTSERFAALARDAGHAVELDVVPGADHHSLYRADVIGPVLEAWLETLTP